MNRIAALLVLTLSLPLAARADEASHRAKAQEMMALLHAEKSVRQISENFMKQITDVGDKAAGANPSPETLAKVADFKKRADQIIEEQVGWTVMQPELTDVYSRTFTEDELDSIIAFYKSPGGTALLTKMPGINSQFQQFGQAHIQAMQPQLQQLFADFTKSLTSPPASPAPASPAAPAAPSTPPAESPAAPAAPSTPSTPPVTFPK